MKKRIKSLTMAIVLLLTTVLGFLSLNAGVVSATEVQQTLIVAKASSSIPNWPASNVIDNNQGTTWSSKNGDKYGGNTTEWVYGKLNSVMDVKEVHLIPRSGGLCFPVNFKFQYSVNGTSWTDITGQSYTGYANPGSNEQTFIFSTAVSAQYIRLYITKESTDGSNYYAQIADIKVYTTVALTQQTLTAAQASSTIPNWPALNIIDNNQGTVWSSNNGDGSGGNTVEWVYGKLNSVMDVKEVHLVPRNGGLCFPADFKFQYSNDGTNWTDVPGQSYTGYTNPGSNEQTFTFGSAVSAQYIRLYITKESTDGSNYYAQMADIKVFTLDSEPGNPGNPSIISTTYSTSDIVVADYIVTNSPYNADSSGINDATTAIQSAINDCCSNGGGTVWLPAGTYKVTGELEIKPYVTVRGDWRDPDIGSGDYGTVISAQVSSGLSGGNVFILDGDASLEGVTVYYPNQSAPNPTAYNATIEIHGGASSANWDCYRIHNVTLLNSYFGIAGSYPSVSEEHQTMQISNVKGTCLFRGLVIYNASNVDQFNGVNINNSYWANAGSAYNAPSLATINSYTQANCYAYEFSGLEFDQVSNLNCSNVNVGAHLYNCVTRAYNSLTFSYCSFQNCTTGVLIENGTGANGQMGNGFIRCSISGSSYAVHDYSGTHILFTDCSLSGTVSGSNIQTSNPGTSPTSYTTSPAFPKVSRAVLYDAVATFNAPYTMPGTVATQDATAAIQNALTAAGNAGGGVVYLRPGWYKISSHLTVPANVVLLGSSPAARDNPGSSNGTVLICYEGKGTTSPKTATAAVTLNGNTAGISNIRFFYPDNCFDNAYPYAIRGNGSSNFAVNIGLVQAYSGIDFETNTCDSHYIHNIQGCIKMVAVAVGASNQGYVDTVSTDHCMGDRNALVTAYGNSLPSNWLTQIQANHCIVEVNGSSNEQILNIFGYGPKTGANVISGTVNIINLAVDGQDQTQNARAVVIGSGTVKVLGIERSVNIGSYNTACSGQVTVFNERNFISPAGATYWSCYYQQ